ncbi:hypothetical protein COCNU_03G002670 [Cocos nucifera]|uniref:F-box domain-containing protein n=1 Tax=Cocos nucifera TaxID=13894 RepID=A0A8K0I1V2_COCNU|nr:hypothetical protein COCNU_03G002670 [Cocos nucifera]
MASRDAPFPSPTPSSSTSSPSGNVAGANQTGPHGALFLVLGYLRLPELLAFQRVCRLFRDVIAGDSLLWQHIVVEPPLSGKLTNDALLKVTAKAEGKLKSLALLDCWKITDAGLLQVADRNPGITKIQKQCTRKRGIRDCAMYRPLADHGLESCAHSNQSIWSYFVDGKFMVISAYHYSTGNESKNQESIWNALGPIKIWIKFMQTYFMQ